MLTPADEDYDVEPDSRLEKFFHIVMLIYGDPDNTQWIERTARKFYAEHRAWLNTETRGEGPIRDPYPDGPTALLQYLVWYSREKQHRLDRLKQEGP